MTHLLAAAQLRADEREGQAAEVAAAAGRADHDVRVVVGQRELGDRLLTDHGLVQQHVVEHAAARVVDVRVAARDLQRLGGGDAEAAGAVRVLGQDRPAGRGFRRWGWPRSGRRRWPSACGGTASGGS